MNRKRVISLCLMFVLALAFLAGGSCTTASGAVTETGGGYLSTFITFKPEISRRYWAAIERNDLPEAIQVIRDFDLPFFKLIGNLKGGFDAGIHAVLEIHGICQRWRRPPHYSLNNAEMGQLEQDMRKTGLLGST